MRLLLCKGISSGSGQGNDQPLHQSTATPGKRIVQEKGDPHLGDPEYRLRRFPTPHGHSQRDLRGGSAPSQPRNRHFLPNQRDHSPPIHRADGNISGEGLSLKLVSVSFSTPYWQTSRAPATPSPEERLGNIPRLREKGDPCRGESSDPIIPLVTDTERETRRLFERLKEEGVEKVTLSYLHLRPAIQEQLMKELSEVHQKLIESFFRTQEWKSVFSSTQTKLLPKTLREIKATRG